MKKINIKLLLLISAASLSMYSLLCVPSAKAYSESSALGSSVLVCSSQIYIDGTKVDNPYEVIAAKSNKPSIFGYTQGNVTVHLTTSDNPGNRITTTDSNGYWIYNTIQPLSRGTHKLYLSLSDNTGAKSSTQMVATFNVPEVLGASANKDTFELPYFLKLNTLELSLVIFALVFLIAGLYMLTRRFRTPEWNALL